MFFNEMLFFYLPNTQINQKNIHDTQAAKCDVVSLA